MDSVLQIVKSRLKKSLPTFEILGLEKFMSSHRIYTAVVYTNTEISQAESFAIVCTDQLTIDATSTL